MPCTASTRYWARYKGLQHSTPAIATWGISLAFAVCLNIINIMPFYYLFLPTWFVSIGAYIVLAKRYGAAESYPEGVKADEEFKERVEKFQQEQAATQSHEHVKDTSTLSKSIKAIYLIVGLGIPIILAWRVLFNSPDLYSYYVNRDLFYSVSIWCTLI